MNIKYYFSAFVFFIVMIPLVSFGQIPLKEYVAKRVVGKAPVIDGHLNDKAWTYQTWGNGFVQYQPYNGKKPSQKTAFKILYDNNNLYVAIRCYDTDPGKIERRLSRRDHADGDWVAIEIDSYFDKLTAFDFLVNAMGVKLDAKYSNDNDMDVTWNAVWYAKTSIDKKGWVAEIKIPFSQLRFSKTPDHLWGLQVVRYEFRNQEESTWQPVPKGVSGWVSKFGLLAGIDNIKPKREIAITPYVMGKLKTAPSISGDPFSTGHAGDYSIGLDGKIAVTNDLTLNFTVNPDFGQVEADPSEVNLSAFETYFRERRPFFVAGNNIFNFPLTAGGGSRNNLFYSRRIGRPPHYSPALDTNEFAKVPEATRILGAFKLSGKTKKGWSIGVLESLTNIEKAVIDSVGKRSQQTVEPMTNYFNARLQKDIKKGKTIIGGMVTATNRFIHDTTLMFLPEAAYTGGIDFQNFWKDKAYTLSAKFAGSTVSGSTKAITSLQEAPQRYYQRPGGDRKVDSTLKVLKGTAASIELAKIGQGHWRYGLRANMLSPGLSVNDQGYMRLSDVIQQMAWVNYVIWEPFSIFRTLNIHFGQWNVWDFKGEKTFSGGNLNLMSQFKNYWYSRMGFERDGYDLHRHELRGGPAVLTPGGWSFYMGIESDQRKKLTFNVHYNMNIGDQQERNSKGVGLGISYQPVPSLKLSLNPNYNQSFSRFKYVEVQKIKGKDVYIISSIKQKVLSTDVRINLSLTPNLSIEYWGQPFLFSADYSNFKKLIHPNLKTFDSQFYTYSDKQITYDKANNRYLIDDAGNESTDFYLANPDFSIMEFRSNMVFRWEFVPGSTLYLVWSQGTKGNSSNGNFILGSNIDQLFKLRPTNVFLLKFSYRISM